MISKKRIWLIIFMVLLGAGLGFYPRISNYLTEKNGNYIIDNYKEEVTSTEQTVLEDEWRKAREYNESLSGNPVHDPFLEGSGMAMQDNYNEVLNLRDTMGVVEIPRISVKLPIYHGTSEKTLQKGVGHLEGSSMPVGGEGSHSVLTGHTGLTNAKLFTDLVELGVGDLFYLHILDKTLAYKVDQILVVEPEETEELRRVPGEDYCTLLTCTPYGVNSHRLLVRGVRTAYIPEEIEEIQPLDTITKEERLLMIASVATTAVMLLLIVIVAVRSKKPRGGIPKEIRLDNKIQKGELRKEKVLKEELQKEKVLKKEPQKEKAHKKKAQKEKTQKDKAQKEELQKDKAQKEELQKEKNQKEKLQKEKLQKEKIQKEKIRKKKTEKKRYWWEE